MIIGVSGFIGSGKSTVGEICSSNGFAQLSFAGSLKDSVSAIFGWDRQLLEGDTTESRNFRDRVDDFWSVKFGKSITPRYILQYYGTEVCRNNLVDTIWIDSLERKIRQHENVVITDVRFNNEIVFLKGMGANLIRVDRNESNPWWYDTYLSKPLEEFEEFARDKIHRSEYEWIATPNIDYTVENNGTMYELRSRVMEVLGGL